MAPQLGPDRAGGLFVSEMITSRALVERNAKTLQLIRFAPDEAPRIHPALRGRPGRRRRRGPHDRRGGPRRPRRSELRLPGAQGDPQGRGSGPAVAHRPVRRHRPQRGPARRVGAVPVTVKMRVGIDADHHTFREAGAAGPGRRGRARRPARPHRAGVLRRARRLGPHRRAGRPARHPGARQRGHLGGRRRGPHGPRDRLRRGRGGPGLPRPALAVRRPRRRLPRQLRAGASGAAHRRGHDAPARHAAGRLARRAARRHRVPQARRLVPQGLRGRRRAALGAGADLVAGRARRPARRARPRPALPRRRARPAAGPHHRRPLGPPAGGLAGRPAHSRDVPAGAELDNSGG